jgi:branched-subunit amino acid aminotransferase/4-amino-4-deoxychorismate lyase
MSSYRASPRRHLANSPFNVRESAPPSEPERYSVEDKVTHDKYGLGTIIGVEEGVSVLVDFRSHARRLRTPCAKLVKL